MEKYNVKGNFFVLSKWVEKYPEILKETFDRGHLIGNHTYSHPGKGDGDFERAEEIIFNIIGVHTNFIRAPHFNKELCKNYFPAVKEEKKIIDSDVRSEDWQYSSEAIKEVIICNTKNGSIISLHDGSQRPEQIEKRPIEMFSILPEVIEKLKEKFEIVRLDELTLEIIKI